MTLLMLGCGKEAGRVPFNGAGQGEATIALGAGEVAFWTDIDLEYQGNAALAYQVELLQNGAPAGRAQCDPLGTLPVKVGWVETQLGDSRSMRGSGKMTCNATLATAGPTTVRARLFVAQRPAAFQLRRADLVVKQ